jgi:DNA polymerase-1
MKTLYILDGYGLIYRSYYAFGGKAIYNVDGQNIGAVLAFFRSLFAIFKTYQPQQFVIALDAKEQSFRMQIYPEYKANRQKAPADLHEQTAIIEQILQQLGVPTIRCTGFEADDVIASLCSHLDDAEQNYCIISADKDLMQLINSRVTMLRPGKDGFVLYDEAKVYEEKGVHPHQILDYLAILGDSSDNIPGITGIGEKGAIKLLQQYGSLDHIYAHLTSIGGAIQKKLQAGTDMAQLSLQLAKLRYDVPLPTLSDDDVSLHNLHYQAAAKLFQQYKIPSLEQECLKRSSPLQEFPELGEPVATTPPAPIRSYTQLKETLHYRLITTSQELYQWYEQMKECTTLAFDCETDGLDTHTAQLVGVSFAWDHGHAVYIPVQAPQLLELTLDDVLKVTRLLLQAPRRIIGQNLKFDVKILQRYDVHFTPSFDTMIAAWMLDSESLYNLDFLSQRYLQYQTITFGSLVAKGQTFADVPLDLAYPYGCEDVDLALQLANLFDPKLKEKGLDHLFYTIEMPLLMILVAMEQRGISVQKSDLQQYSHELAHQLLQLEQDIHTIAGTSFNINSPKQLQEILYTQLQLPKGKKISTGLTTDASTLEELSAYHPLPGKVLEYRTLSKLKSTYTDKLPKDVLDDGRIHCQFMQNGAATGRLACREPNLQNIPIRDEAGRRIRQAFVSTPGHLLISADYHQIELVVLAYLAQDQQMLDIFEHGRDLHKETAAFMFQCSLDSVTSDQRRAAKSVNFGILYGMSAFRLSNELKISRSQAESFINAYFQRYRRVQDFMASTIEKGKATGGVSTVLGRWRPIPQLQSRNKNELQAASRVAINTVIQGSAADIIKTAMLNVHTALEQHQMGHLLLQVHDELIVETKAELVTSAADLIKEHMQRAASELPIPMRMQVGVEYGKNWGEFH